MTPAWRIFLMLAPYYLLIALACVLSALVLVLKSRTPVVRGLERTRVPRSPWDSLRNCARAFGQLLTPVILLQVLTWVGDVDCEGGWARTPATRALSLSMLWLPAFVGTFTAILSPGRRLPIALCAIAST